MLRRLFIGLVIVAVLLLAVIWDVWDLERAVSEKNPPCRMCRCGGRYEECSEMCQSFLRDRRQEKCKLACKRANGEGP